MTNKIVGKFMWFLQLGLFAVALIGMLARPVLADSKLFLPLVSNDKAGESLDSSWSDGSGACLFTRGEENTATLWVTANSSLSPYLYIVTSTNDVEAPFVLDMYPRIVPGWPIDDDGESFVGYTYNSVGQKVIRCTAQYEHRDSLVRAGEQQYPYLEYLGTEVLNEGQADEEINNTYFLHCGGNAYQVTIEITWTDGAVQVVVVESGCDAKWYVAGAVSLAEVIAATSAPDEPPSVVYLPVVMR